MIDFLIAAAPTQICKIHCTIQLNEDINRRYVWAVHNIYRVIYSITICFVSSDDILWTVTCSEDHESIHVNLWLIYGLEFCP